MTPADKEKANAMAAKGYNSAQIAEALSVSSTAVHRAIRNGNHARHCRIFSHRDAVADMRPLDAIEYLLEVIEAGNMENDRAQIVSFVQAGFTSQQATILVRLVAAKGRTITTISLLDTLCRGRNEAFSPAPSYVGVLIHNIRKKLPDGCRIMNVHGHGYFFEQDPEVVAPWEGCCDS